MVRILLLLSLHFLLFVALQPENHNFYAARKNRASKAASFLDHNEIRQFTYNVTREINNTSPGCRENTDVLSNMELRIVALGQGCIVQVIATGTDIPQPPATNFQVTIELQTLDTSAT